MGTLRDVLCTTGDDGKEGVPIGGKWPTTARLKYQSASPHHHLALQYDDMVGKSRATCIANPLLAGSAAILDSLVAAIRKQKPPSSTAAKAARGASSEEAKALRAEMTAVITQAKEEVEKVPLLCSSRVGEEYQAVVPTMSSKRPSSSVDPMEPSAKSAAVVMDRSTQRRIEEMEQQITDLTTQNQTLAAEKQTMERRLQTLGDKLGRLQIIESREHQLKCEMDALQRRYDDKVAEARQLGEKLRKMPSPSAALSTARSKLLLLIRKYASS